MKKSLFFIPCFVLLNFFADATHIVGGYMAYQWISDSTYFITLTVFRNCNSTTYFDQPAYVAIFDANTNELVEEYDFNNLVVTNINPPNNPCLQVTTDVCVQQGVYTQNVTLPSSTSGYIITYQRCCRNNSISNITDPGDQGETFFAYIPPTVTYHNSNPTFINYPPVFICVNTPLKYDHSAVDIDTNDVLRYSLCTPYTGANSTNPQPDPPSNPPYATITWAPGYSTANMLGGNPPLTIDSITGLLTGTPNSVGQFVVGVCVSQYRNGQLLTTNLRDFQFNVTQCNSPVADIPSANINPENGIGIYTSNCQNYTVVFQNNSYNPPPTNVPLYYAWNFGVAGSSTDTSTQEFPTYTYPDTGTYTVQLVAIKGTGSEPCTDTTEAIVKIYPKMVANFDDKDTCANGPVAFIDSGTNSYGTIDQWTWNFGDGDTSALENPVHTYSSPGTYSVQLIEGNSEGCLDTVSKTIQIYITSEAKITAQPTCVGAPVDFTSTAASDFEWNFGNGSTSTASNPTDIFSSPGNYVIQLKSHLADGCEDSVSKTITIHNLPIPVISDDTTVCSSDSVQLYASGGSEFVWTPSGSLNNPDIFNPVALPANSYSATTYYVTVTDTNQCTNRDSVTVSIFPAPFIGAGPDTAVVCQHGGDSTNVVQLHAGGGVSYQWSPDTGLSNPDVANPVATLPGNVTITYTVAVTDIHNCITRDSASLLFYRPIAINPGPDTSFCTNSGPAINVVQLYSGGGILYQWSPATGLSDTSISNPVATIPANTTATYTVTVTDVHQCYNSDSVKITLYPLVVITTIPADTVVCAGGIFNFSVQLNATGAANYVWSPATGLSNPDIANPVASPTSGTIYYVTGTDTHGCTGSDSVIIKTNALPVPSLTPDTISCGDSVQLNAGGGNAYSWQPDTGLSCTNCPNPTAAGGSTITYTVAISNSTTGCGVLDSVTITDDQIFVSPYFRDTIVVKGNTVTLEAKISGGNGQNTYLWSPSTYLNDSALATPVSTPTADITYLLLATSGVCSDTTTIYVEVLDSILVQIPNAFTPNGDGHDDYFFPVFNSKVGWVLKEMHIYNRYGQLIYTGNEAPGWDGRFKGAEQPVGTYVYYMLIDQGLDGEHKYEGAVTLLR